VTLPLLDRKIDRNAARDQRVQRPLRRLGWGVMVVWEYQTAARKLDRLRNRLAAFLGRASRRAV
jgi:G:T-mismatch repair DNA endonuclease (very short patch repair protein)